MKNKILIILIVVTFLFVVGLSTGCSNNNIKVDSNKGLNLDKTEKVMCGNEEYEASKLKDDLYLYNFIVPKGSISYDDIPGKGIPMLFFGGANSRCTSAHNGSTSSNNIYVLSSVRDYYYRSGKQDIRNGEDVYDTVKNIYEHDYSNKQYLSKKEYKKVNNNVSYIYLVEERYPEEKYEFYYDLFDNYYLKVIIQCNGNVNCSTSDKNYIALIGYLKNLNFK